VKRIHDSLARVLDRHRLVFWYDPAMEWGETFDAFEGTGIEKLRVENNEFGTKVRIARHPEGRFLVFVPGSRPHDADNWLFDLLLQGHEYRADKASLALLDVGLSQEFQELAEEHAGFFNSAKRSEALRDILSSDDQPRGVRLKMMAVLAGTAADVDAMLLRFLSRGAQSELADPVAESLGPFALAESFWREVHQLFDYTAPEPTLRDFAVTLFRGANPLDAQVSLHPHAHVFLQRWKDSQAHRFSYEEWANRMAAELQIEAALNVADARTTLGDSDAFELFEKFSVQRLSRAFQRGDAASEMLGAIQLRKASFWRAKHADGYAALEHAIALRELLAGADLAVESLAAGAKRYAGHWWRIDAAYRRCVYHMRRYAQVPLMEPVRDWIEGHYINDFLLPLADRWGDQVDKLLDWECDELPKQRTFFDTWVQPFRSRGQKVFVIVSDALRYEAAADFAERLRASNRWSADVEACLSALPSYTQLGMASLLPGSARAVDAATGAVMVDGRSASGTAGRNEILASACEGRATAVQSELFLEMNTKTEGRALMRDHDVVYIYHNKIDVVGDKAATEAQTTDAVEQAFQELDAIIKKIANINGTNMLLTADHGFLFQQDPVDDGDMAALPAASEWTYRSRRFALGRQVTSGPGVKLFSAAQLGVGGDWTAAFPRALGRFPLQGSGKRYVHGGITLQEVIVPVVRIHKARADDTERVEVDVMRIPAKITTGRLPVAFFQDRPAVEKVRARTLRVGLFTKDGTLISEQKTIPFDSPESEPRLREMAIVLVLSAVADAHNNRDVELRLEEMVQGTNQWVTYRAHDVKLQKPFASDFDDL
jgi:uncharacterized protein (TIGR02687 family)